MTNSAKIYKFPKRKKKMPNDPRSAQRVERKQQRLVQKDARRIEQDTRDARRRAEQAARRAEQEQRRASRPSGAPPRPVGITRGPTPAYYNNVPLSNDRAVASAGLMVRPALDTASGQVVKLAVDPQSGEAVAKMPASLDEVKKFAPGLAKKLPTEGTRLGDDEYEDDGYGGDYSDGGDWRNYGEMRSSFNRQDHRHDNDGGDEGFRNDLASSEVSATAKHNGIDLRTDEDVAKAGLTVREAVDKKTGKVVKVAVDPVTGQPVAAQPVEKKSAIPAVAAASALWLLMFV